MEKSLAYIILNNVYLSNNPHKHPGIVGDYCVSTTCSKCNLIHEKYECFIAFMRSKHKKLRNGGK